MVKTDDLRIRSENREWHRRGGEFEVVVGKAHLSVVVSHKHLDASLTPCPRFCPIVT